MKDKKTVIITTLNAAWTEPNSIFDLFIESFKIGNGTEKLLRHVVVATLDQKAHSRCLKARFLHCYTLTTQAVDISGEAFFMSEDYLKMMWRRIDFLTTVLQMGFDFVFTDADVMWLRDPFETFYPDVDFQIACDYYWFNSTDRSNSPNGGFNYVRSNNRTVQFYKFWYESRERFPGQHDQDVLNNIKFNPFIQDIGLEIRFLDTAHFGGFCEPSKDQDLVVTMHANCCIGLGNKIHDIRMVIDDWKKYLSLSSNERNLISRSWTVPRICG
ncbi:nucleotide-diphospho-sugar transferase family protein [Striga asiatica]|uniref:Glycosyltransferase n=1 Tax=Striga asiatica TaxID=4170 RepID=A0A5A7QW30_STRAF|nr:nucleotide-diphospho-sugar transferase family protein [Striga asiatica]